MVSLQEAVLWPPSSPDLSPRNFFRWIYLTTEIYKHRPRFLEQLKEAIREEITWIKPDTLVRVMANFQERLDVRVNRQSRHLDDIIF